METVLKDKPTGKCRSGVTEPETVQGRGLEPSAPITVIVHGEAVGLTVLCSLPEKGQGGAQNCGGFGVPTSACWKGASSALWRFIGCW